MAFSSPARDGSDSYISDPGKPVSYLPVPISFGEGDRWRTWLVTDQRFAANRPDVLTYETAPLTEPLHLSDAPIADLFAATTGTDADWIVKLIDVYPDEFPDRPEMGGYQLSISMDIFRGRPVARKPGYRPKADSIYRKQSSRNGTNGIDRTVDANVHLFSIKGRLH